MKKLEDREESLDLIHFSIIPWIAFTSFKHARRFRRADTIPKIVLGKVYNENGVMKIPVWLEVHHAIMDGIHVGKYFWELKLVVRQAY
ncbi:MAG: CatA-like O-acetyltransferase [Bacteroidia bacterium]